MKTKFFIILSLSYVIIYGQYDGNYDIDFDDQYGIEFLFVDTISNHENIWQIGSPEKNSFDEAYSAPNAICTDLVNPYPVNDTSTFTITNIAAGGFENNYFVILEGKYMIDSDSLNDFGLIEFSPDKGHTWIDLINDTIYLHKGCYEWWTDRPSFTGKTNGWKDFGVQLAGFGDEFNLHWPDTVIYRFTFISDSIQTNRSGWILDDLHFEDWWESIIDNRNNSFNSEVYPNPAENFVTIKFPNEERKNINIVVFDKRGALIKLINTNSEFIEIDLSSFKPGTYHYVVKKKNERSSGEIIIL